MPNTPPPNPCSGSENHYQRLRLPTNANQEELRQAFRMLSKLYHPDTTSLPPEQAEQAFRDLRQAYAVLGDPQSRSLYDAQLQQQQSNAVAKLTPIYRSTPLPVRRALSGGEWFALLLLAIALVLSLVLGIGLAWARGTAMVQWPSWWSELQTGAVPEVPLEVPASEPDGASPP